ncbi:MAG TPA: hypothetical protein VIZ31_10385 [Vicinamibacteria bacterium]
MSPRRALTTLLCLVGLSFGPAAPARALEITAFLSTGSPSEVWGSGVGAALTSTLFKIVMLDAELARQGYETGDGRLLSFSAAACLAPTIGPLTPYAGFAVGVQRQTLNEFGGNGTLKSVLGGVKLKLGLLVVRAEYRTFELSGTPLLDLDHRIYAGAGISF